MICNGGALIVASIDLTHDNVTRKPCGLLARLRDDTRGNTLAIVAASMIPIAGFIGSGLDMSRAYLVKTRLQQACDAGSLAARKSMSGTTLTTADKAEGERYFRYNFPDGTMGTTALASATTVGPNTIVLGTDSNNQVTMTATATMPNTIMNLFGFATQEIAATCKAEEFYVNTDVMLVLDTTGSMNCTISDPTSCGQPTEKTGSKMGELRSAVKKLYASLRPAQEALEGKNLRMRIGWVPYAATVNVGKLVYAKDSTAIRNPGIYYNTGGTSYTGVTRPASWFTGTGASDWNGCIEERSTDNSISSSTTSIPATAFDLDIATMPTSNQTRWVAHDPSQLQNWNLWTRDNGSTMSTSTSSFSGASYITSYGDPTVEKYGFSNCPRPAVALRTWGSITEFNGQVDQLVTGRGGTYHDIGMIWGTRMIANTGIFGTDNPDTFNAVKVRRTIVLVTDGIMSPNSRTYGAYSRESSASRTYTGAGLASYNNDGSPANTQAIEYRARHEKRFNLMCDRAKSMNIDVWVVAILDKDTPITTSLTNCASGGQAIKVENTTALEAAFKAISDKVGNLRLGS